MSSPHHNPVDPDQPVNPDYQDKDLHLGTVTRFIVVSLLFTLVTFILMVVMSKSLKEKFISDRGEASIRQIPTKDQALLQTLPLVDLKEYYDLEHTRLNTLTNAGVHAVIPIDAAMALMVQEGAFPLPAGVEHVVEPAAHSHSTSPAEPAHQPAPVVESHPSTVAESPTVTEPVAKPHAVEPVAVHPEPAPVVPTAMPVPTETPVPAPTATPVPVPTATPVPPAPTATPVPAPTFTPVPTATAKPATIHA